MPTVGGHQQSAFTTPVNGGALDASVVLGNDNNVRTAHNDHDNDATIHVQSSVVGSRPAAGTAGRFWMTTDSNVPRLWYDNGTSWFEIDYLNKTQGGTVSGATTVSGTLDITGTLTRSAAATSGSYLRGNGTSIVLATIQDADLGTSGTPDATTFLRGDRTWASPGAARFAVDGWYFDNLSGTSSSIMYKSGTTTGSGNIGVWIPARAGSLIGAWVRSSEARTAGTATFTVTKNAVSTALVVTLDGTNTQTHTATSSAGSITFAAGDRIGITWSTTGWTPTTADVLAGIEAQFD